MASPVLQTSVAAVGYWGAFAVTALACFAAVGRARDVQDAAVQRGLVGLLVTTGGWALLKTVFFLAPDPIRVPAYTIGLVLGFGTVWAWLYFCSAYTGREYHRNQTLRRLGAGVFLGVVAVKLTNPIHGLYFSTSQATTPFPHLAIEHGVFHWTVTGLSYALAAAGLFMLFELYVESGYDTRPLGVLTVFLGLPVTLDIAALLTPLLIDVIYAPLGVAVFVIGVLFVYERRFLAVQETGEDDDAVIFLDDQDCIRDHTPAAASLFPPLDDAVGDPLSDVLPAVADVVDADEQILEWSVDGEQRYFLASTSSLTLGDTEGSVLAFSDVTTAEQRRRELERHNEQLEGFASALAHELRNVLQIVDWRLATASERMEEGTVAHESVETAASANDRMDGLVNDFTRLARYGQTIERLRTVEFGEAAEDAWFNAETGEMHLVIEATGTLDADPGRLRELLTNAFEFALYNDADTVTVALGDGGFRVTDDGEPPGEDVEGYLAYGESLPTAEAGMKLPNVKTFARVHGWEADIDTDYRDGVRVVVSGVTTDAGESGNQAERL